MSTGKRETKTHDVDVPRLALARLPLLLPRPTAELRRHARDGDAADRRLALRVGREVLERALDARLPHLGDVALEDDAQLLAHGDEVDDVGRADDAVERLLDDVERVVERGGEVGRRGEVSLVHQVRLRGGRGESVTARRR